MINSLNGLNGLCRPYSKKNYKSPKRFREKSDFEDITFSVKIRDIYKIEKNNSISISVSGYGNKEKYAIYVLKKLFEEKHVNLLLIEEGDKNSLSKILVHLFMIIHHTGEENIFVIIIYRLLVQKEY